MIFRLVSSLFIANNAIKRGGIAPLRTDIARSMSMVDSFPCVSNRAADVHLVPMFNDNYGFILVDKATRKTACVDPGDGPTMLDALNKMSLQLDAIFCTHKHADHVGGNSELKAAFPDAQVIGTRYEHVPGLNKPVGDGDKFEFGALKVSVYHTPCHTKGHVVFLVERNTMDADGTGDDSISDGQLQDAPLLFCGDTLFNGGCGRFFEGTAEEMLKNMDLLASLPADTQVYCAHEYTESNMKFLAHVDPQICGPVLKSVRQQRAAGQFTVPSTIGEQLKYNLFIKCREQRTQQLTGTSSPVEAMAALRTMKNNF